MLSLKRQGDQRLSDTQFLYPVEQSKNNDSTRHLTLAVNDARRRQLYFALYDELLMDGGSDTDTSKVPQQEVTQHHRVDVRELVAMDIDYPQHIVERIHATLNDFATTSDSEGSYRIDIIGHGAAKYADEWQKLGEMLGCVVEASVLDAGAVGLEIFAECALCANGVSGSKTKYSTQGDSAENDQIKPVEPLYLRRPDVSVPNPLKHVLNHAGVTRS